MIPNLLHVVDAIKAQHPTAWRQAHTGSAQTEDFIRLLAAACHAVDPRFGLNGKRGNPADLSDDALNCLDPVDGPGRTPDGRRCWVIDVIGAAGGPSPVAQWAQFTDPLSSSGAWVTPGAAVVPAPPVVVPPPVAVPQFPPRDQGLQFFSALDEKYKTKGYPETIYRVDKEGVAVWYADYLRHRVAGLDHAAAQAKVFADIDAVWAR